MKKRIGLLAAMMAFGVQAGTAEDVRAVIDENLKHTQSENASGVMSTVHKASPGYGATQQMLNQLFPAYDLKYTVLSYEFVGEEGGYAYARIVQRTEKVAGPAFNNNDLEALQIFKKENGQWKLWTQANLNINFL